MNDSPSQNEIRPGDEEAGGGPRPEANGQRQGRWSLDPRWFASTGARREISPALNMLNELIRAPYHFRRSTSETGRAPASVPLPGPSSNNGVPAARPRVLHHRGSLQVPMEQHSIAQQGPSTSMVMANAVRGILQGAGRARSLNGAADIPEHPTGVARSNSESYVVMMEADPNWNASQAAGSQPVAQTGEQQQNEGTPDEERGSMGESNRSGEGTPTTPFGPGYSPGEMLRTTPEGQAILSVIERYSPFLIILLIKCLFDHGSGIICFLALLLTFSHANSLFKKEVSKQGKRKLTYLLMIAANLLICMGFVFYVYNAEKLYMGLIFLQTATPIESIWTMFWITATVDFVTKFITIVIKILVLMCPARMCPYQKRGKYYLFVERTSQLYRAAIPTFAWVQYLSGSYEGPSAVLGFILVALYGLLKLNDIAKRYKAWYIAFVKMLQQVHYGTTPTEVEMKEAGDVCPICHDVFQDPTKLNCTHIFCEECVTTWFDRERTCPMCRANVVDDPSYRDGHTTHFIQIF